MAPNISGNLSRISKAASKINKLADEATEQIRALDAQLGQMDPGVSVQLSVAFATGREENSSGHRMPTGYLLGYGRDDDGKFGIVVEAWVDKTDDEGKPVIDYDDHHEEETAWVRRLERVSRELRIAAIEQLPELVELLAKKADETVEKLSGAVDKTRSIVDELKAALPESKVTVYGGPEDTASRQPPRARL